jgi:hypothetical protein
MKTKAAAVVAPIYMMLVECPTEWEEIQESGETGENLQECHRTK